MTIEIEWALPCYDGRKSFYGKAYVLEDGWGNAFLRSYDTIVCYIDPSGYFHRLWDGWSVTTQRHVDSFITEYNLPHKHRGKAAWMKMPVEKFTAKEE